jgi:hypothetical protein
VISAATKAKNVRRSSNDENSASSSSRRRRSSDSSSSEVSVNASAVDDCRDFIKKVAKMRRELESGSSSNLSTTKKTVEWFKQFSSGHLEGDDCTDAECEKMCTSAFNDAYLLGRIIDSKLSSSQESPKRTSPRRSDWIINFLFFLSRFPPLSPKKSVKFSEISSPSVAIRHTGRPVASPTASSVYMISTSTLENLKTGAEGQKRNLQYFPNDKNIKANASQFLQTAYNILKSGSLTSEQWNLVQEIYKVMIIKRWILFFLGFERNICDGDSLKTKKKLMMKMSAMSFVVVRCKFWFCDEKEGLLNKN